MDASLCIERKNMRKTEDEPKKDYDVIRRHNVTAIVDNSLINQNCFGSEGEHCHSFREIHEEEDEISRTAAIKLRIAIIICLLFMLTEIVGGFLADSLSILADAAHLFTDLIALVIGLISIHLKTRPASKKFSFGWYRAEILGSLLSIALIWLITGILVYVAGLRIYNHDYNVDGQIMLLTAGAGVAFNLVIGIVLSASEIGHLHSHGGSEGQSDQERNILEGENKNYGTNGSRSDSPHSHSKNQNINVRAAFIHIIGDLCQSLGVLIAAYIIFYYPEYSIADPICTFVFSIIVLITTYRITVDLLSVLMEGAPRHIQYSLVKAALLTVNGVKRVHNLRIWSLSLDTPAVSVHLAVETEAGQKTSDCRDVLQAVTRILNEDFKIYETTVQIEDYSTAMEKCQDCEDPSGK